VYPVDVQPVTKDRNLDGDPQFHRVSRTVNSVKNQGGDCIEPVNPL
jgi:hypothetical protein